MIPGYFQWDDVGDFAAVSRLRKSTNGNGVTVHGDENNVVVVDGSGLIVNHTDRVVAIAGIKDIVVVDTPDALLVTTAANAQKVKQLVAEIKASKRPEVL